MPTTDKLTISAAKYGNLLTALDRATAMYTCSKDPIQKRNGWISALHAVNEFLHHLPDADVHRQHLFAELTGALEDANEGRENALLKKSTANPKRRTLSMDNANFATAAACIQFFKLAGEKLEVAARRVARKAREIGASLPRQTGHNNRPDHLRLLDWRKRMLSATNANPASPKYAEARQIYDCYMEVYQTLQREKEATPLQLAEFFLNEIWPHAKRNRCISPPL